MEQTHVREPTLWVSSLTGSPMTTNMSMQQAVGSPIVHAPAQPLRQEQPTRTVFREPVTSLPSVPISSLPMARPLQVDRTFTPPVPAHERPASFGPVTLAAAAAAVPAATRRNVVSPRPFREEVTQVSSSRSTIGGLSPFSTEKSQLCVLAGVRGRRWGSLQTSWLVKNTFEAWRSLSYAMETKPVERPASPPPPQSAMELRILELERLLAEKDRVIATLGQQLSAVDLKVHVDTDAIASAVLAGLSHKFDLTEHVQSYHEQVMNALSGIQPQQADLSEVMDAIRGLNTDVDHGPVLDAIRGLNLEVDHAPVLEEVRRLSHVGVHHTEVRGALDDLRRSVSVQQVDHEPVLSELQKLHVKSETLHGDLHRRVDAIEGLHEEHRGSLDELLQVRRDVHTLREELARDIAVVRAEARETANTWARDAEILTVKVLEIQKAVEKEQSLTPVLSAIASSRNSLLAAIEGSKVDLNPVVGHIRGLQPVADQDLSPVLLAVREATHSILSAVNSRVQVEMDYTPMLSAVRDAKSSILSAITSWEVDHSPVLDSIRGINIQVDNSPMLGAVHDAKVSILSAISSWEVDHSPVLDSIRNINIEVDLTPVTDGLRSLHSSIQPADMSPVVTAIRGAESRIVSAVGGNRLDLVPFVDEVHSRHTEAMQAIRRIRVDPVDLSPTISAINTVAADLERAINKLNFEVDHSEVLRAIRGMRHPETDLAPVLQAISRCERDLQSSISRLQGPDVGHVISAVQSAEASLERSIRGIHIPSADFAPVLAAVKKVDADVERGFTRLRSEVLETIGDLEPEQPDLSSVIRGIHNLGNRMDAELLPIMHELRKVEPDLSHVVHEIHRSERELLQALQPEMAAILAGLSATEVDMGPVLRSLERNRIDEGVIAQTVNEVLRTERRDHDELIEAIRQLKLLLVSRPGPGGPPPPPVRQVPMASATFPAARFNPGVPLLPQLQQYFTAWHRSTLASGPPPGPRPCVPPPGRQMQMLGPPPTLGMPPCVTVESSQRLALQPLANKIDGFMEELDYSRAWHTPPGTPKSSYVREVHIDGSPASPRARSRLGYSTSRTHLMERVSP